MTRASKLPGRPTLRVIIASGVTVCSVSRRMARASLGSAWRSTCTGGTCHSFTPMSRAGHATVQDRRDSEKVPKVQMSTHNASEPAGVTPGTVPVPPSFPLSTASETFNTPPLPSLSPRQHHRAGGRASPAPRRRRHCRLGERAGRPRGHDCHHRRCWPRRLAVPPCRCHHHCCPRHLAAHAAGAGAAGRDAGGASHPLPVATRAAATATAARPRARPRRPRCA